MFEYSDKSKEFQARLAAFMEAHVFPNEGRYAAQLHESRGVLRRCR